MTDPRQQADDALRQSHAELRSHTEALTRFDHIAVGRELCMISKLEQEVNELCQRHGEAARYPVEFKQDTKPTKATAPAVLPRKSLVPLQSVLCTEELSRRPTRPPDYVTENRALVALAQTLADSPRTILQTLAENILEVLEADSAGVSLLTEDEQSFFWAAIAGAWQPHLGGGTPRDFGPCGDVLDCNAPLLFKHPERRYDYFMATTPPAEECLLVPFHIEGKAVGTIWAIAHDDLRKFDAEDLRLLESLGGFASAAYQAHTMGALEQRRAVLRLEDAVQSGQAMEKLNAELHESEDALRRSEAHLRDFVENACLGLQWVGPDGIILWANQTGLDLLGYSREEYIGHHIADFHADQPVIEDILVRLTGGETLHDHEARLRCKDGAIRHVLISSNALFENEKFVHTRCFTRDITERKQAEEALRRSEEFNRSIIESSPDCIKVLDLEGNLLSMQNGQALLGIEDIRPYLNKSWIEFWEGEDCRAARAAVEAAAAGGAGNFVGFLRTLHGEPKWWDVAISPIRDANGKPARLLAVSRDVTQRKHVDEALRDTQGFLRSSLDALTGHVAVLDESGMILEVNDAWRRFADENRFTGARYGVGASYLQDCGQTFPQGSEAPTYARGINDVIAGRLARFEIEYPCHSPTAQRWFVMRVTRFQSPGPVRILVVHDNCTERKLAEDALRPSEERYRNLFNSMDEGYCIIEMIYDDNEKPVDWRFLEVNPSFEKQTGLHDTTGKRMREFAPNHEEYWFEIYGKVALTGEPVRFVNEAKDMNGRWFDAYACRVGGPDSRKVAIIFNDISERRRSDEALRKSEERYRNLFNSIDEGFCVIEMIFDEHEKPVDWRYLEVNPSFEKQSGIPEATGKRIVELVPTLEASWFEIFGKVARTGEPVRFVNESKELTGWFDVYAFRIAAPEDRKVAVIFNNITERTKAEQALRDSAEALADLDRRKDEFLAMLGHELRNPLAPISNATHLLRLQKNEDPLQQKARNIIERQVGQLKHLVDDLLEISRITTGRVQLRQERIVVSGIVKRAVETADPLIVQRRHELTVSLPPQPIWLHADAARLEQVVVNLLTNAAKYTDEGGHIWLTVQQEGDAVVLRVRDTGIGIAPELLPRIFDLFTQAERSLDRSQGGLGIGLCLVRRLVDLHGGTVKAHSVVGQGSEFVVRLPVMLTSTPPSPSRSIETAPPSGKLCGVLVVDDNVDAAQSLAMLLEMLGHEVRMAYDGPTALEAAFNHRLDMVLLDIGLPGLNGFEVAKRIRQQPTHKDIVLVAMTGYGQEADRKRSYEAGFDHHLAKPVDFGELQKILATVSEKATVTPAD